MKIVLLIPKGSDVRNSVQSTETKKLSIFDYLLLLSNPKEKGISATFLRIYMILQSQRLKVIGLIS